MALCVDLRIEIRPLTQEERYYLGISGWVPLAGKWIDPLLFEEEGFMAPFEYDGDALRIQNERDVAKLETTIEWQRKKLLGLLSTRKRGPIPLEQQRAGLLFALERRAIRLIEDS